MSYNTFLKNMSAKIFTFSDEGEVTPTREFIEKMKNQYIPDMVKLDDKIRNEFIVNGIPIAKRDESSEFADYDRLSFLDSMDLHHIFRPGKDENAIESFFGMTLDEYTDSTREIGLVITNQYVPCSWCEFSLGDSHCEHSMNGYAFLTSNLDRPIVNQCMTTRHLIIFKFTKNDTILNCIARILVYLEKNIPHRGDDSTLSYSEYYDPDPDLYVPELICDFCPFLEDFHNWFDSLEVHEALCLYV